MTVEELPNFINHMINDYEHDYGTACHAVAACALAAAWATCGDPIGLTGFQAGFVMWDFILNWTMTNNECGLKLVDYDNFLYPQYQDELEKTIKKSTFERIQDVAKEKLKEYPDARPNVIAHWQSIVDGVAPFGYKVVDDTHEA